MNFKITLISAALLGCATTASYAAPNQPNIQDVLQEFRDADANGTLNDLYAYYAKKLQDIDIDDILDNVDLSDGLGALQGDDLEAVAAFLGVDAAALATLSEAELREHAKDFLLGTMETRSSQINRAAVYAALPAIGLNLNKFVLSDMQGRLGGAERSEGSDQHFWAQALGGKTSASMFDGDSTSYYGPQKPTYKQNLYGVQVGGDVWRSGANRAGVFGAVGAGNATINGPLDGRAGKISSQTLALGTYFNHTNPNGWYVDTALQVSGQEHKMRANLGQGAKDKMNVKAVGVALQTETGYKFKLGEGYSITPNVGVLGQMLHIKNPKNEGATLKPKYGRQNEVTTRIGLRMAKTWDTRGAGAMQLWVEPQYSHQFIKQTKMTVALNGSETQLNTDLPGGSVGVNGGFSAAIDKTTTIGVGAGYMKQLKGMGHSVNATLSLNKAF